MARSPHRRYVESDGTHWTWYIADQLVRLDEQQRRPEKLGRFVYFIHAHGNKRGIAWKRLTPPLESELEGWLLRVRLGEESSD